MLDYYYYNNYCIFFVIIDFDHKGAVLGWTWLLPQTYLVQVWGSEHSYLCFIDNWSICDGNLQCTWSTIVFSVAQCIITTGTTVAFTFHHHHHHHPCLFAQFSFVQPLFSHFFCVPVVDTMQGVLFPWWLLKGYSPSQVSAA